MVLFLVRIDFDFPGLFQAELFVLRLSRYSGVLGLAGMPFTSQIFSTHTHSCAEVSRNHGILVVRPLLDLVKEDMYKVGAIELGMYLLIIHFSRICILNQFDLFSYTISEDM